MRRGGRAAVGRARLPIKAAVSTRANSIRLTEKKYQIPPRHVQPCRVVSGPVPLDGEGQSGVCARVCACACGCACGCACAFAKVVTSVPGPSKSTRPEASHQASKALIYPVHAALKTSVDKEFDGSRHRQSYRQPHGKYDRAADG